MGGEEEDRAALAYAAISSQLSEWGNILGTDPHDSPHYTHDFYPMNHVVIDDNDDDVTGSTYHLNTLHSPNLRWKNEDPAYHDSMIQEGGEYDRNGAEDMEEEWEEKGEDGKSMLFRSTPFTTTPVRTPPPYYPSQSRNHLDSMMTRTTASHSNKKKRGDTNSDTYTSPLLLFPEKKTTPQKQQQPQQRQKDEVEVLMECNEEEETYEQEEEKVESQIDGDYKPYHDALLRLLRSIHQTHESAMDSAAMSSSIAQRQLIQSFLQFLKLLCHTCYNRTSLNTDPSISNTAAIYERDQSQMTLGDDQNGDLLLLEITELEGNLWDLLYRLLYESSLSIIPQTRTNEDTNNLISSTVRSKSMNSLSFLLWNTEMTTQMSHSGTHIMGDYFIHQRHFIDTWIQSFVTQNQNLDPAAIHQLLIQSCLHNSTDELLVANNDEPIVLQPIPELIHRRQIIYDWIQACHSRRVPLTSSSHTSSKSSKNVMWKDTLQHLSSQRKLNPAPTADFTSMNSSKKHDKRVDNSTYKCTSIHPDAALIITLQAARERRGGPLVNPLYGKDDMNELILLSTCLSFLKAGRFETDAFDLCRYEYGQPWRAAAWGGNDPCGYLLVHDGEKNVPTLSITGNPQRALWKRVMWNISQKLYHALNQNTSSSGSTSTVKSATTTSSFLYEAAISAVLADDTATALQNPLLNKSYMDMIWLYFRGMQSRFLEEVYVAHNNMRRKVKWAQDLPPVGTQFEEEEKEQLACTEAIKNLDEREIYRRLEQTFGRIVSSGHSFHDKVIWETGIGAFLGGYSFVERYIVQACDCILNSTDYYRTGNDAILSTKPSVEAFLRFMTHLLLFLDFITDEHLAVMYPSTGTDAKHFKALISTRRNDTLLVYVHNLKTQKSLWHMITLYASLLPTDVLVDFCTMFWASSVFENKDRIMILKQAREYFSEGLDLVILRRVVRRSILTDERHDDDDRVESLRKKPVQMNSSLNFPIQSIDTIITKSDHRKMHSLSWMCYYPEHYADAIVCSNMLLRMLLLKANLDNDGLDDPHLYTAKVFISRFLPSDLVDTSMKLLNLSEDGNDNYKGYLIHRNKALDELNIFRAISIYLEAHSIYQVWKNTIETTSPTTEVSKQYVSGTLEGDIGNNMEKNLFIKKKRESGYSLVQIAERARKHLLEVVTFEGGWLSSSLTKTDLNDDESTVAMEEMRTLRAKLIPSTVFFLVNVLNETAHWLNVFVCDVISVYGKEESDDVLSSIDRSKLLHDDGVLLSRPLLPETWYRMTLNLATDVASEEHGIVDCFSQTQLKDFVGYMADTAAALLLCEER